MNIVKFHRFCKFCGNLCGGLFLDTVNLIASERQVGIRSIEYIHEVTVFRGRHQHVTRAASGGKAYGSVEVSYLEFIFQGAALIHCSADGCKVTGIV